MTWTPKFQICRFINITNGLSNFKMKMQMTKFDSFMMSMNLKSKIFWRISTNIALFRDFLAQLQDPIALSLLKSKKVSTLTWKHDRCPYRRTLVLELSVSEWVLHLRTIHTFSRNTTSYRSSKYLRFDIFLPTSNIDTCVEYNF